MCLGRRSEELVTSFWHWRRRHQPIIIIIITIKPAEVSSLLSFFVYTKNKNSNSTPLKIITENWTSIFSFFDQKELEETNYWNVTTSSCSETTYPSDHSLDSVHKKKLQSIAARKWKKKDFQREQKIKKCIKKKLQNKRETERTTVV